MNKPPVPSVRVRNLTLKTGDPKICVSVSDRLQADILETCRALVREPLDLIEWRVDHYVDHNSDHMVKDTLSEIREIIGDIPLIFTMRTTAEGGRADLKLWDYIKICRESARTDLADLFDIEYRIMVQLPHDVVNDIKKHAKIIVSKHDFNGTPGYDALVDDLVRLQVSGGDIAKLAVMPADEEDVARMVKASREITRHYTSTPIITISMGALGVETRVKCVDTGSCITFGSVGRASAPGQLSVRELRSELEKNRLV